MRKYLTTMILGLTLLIGEIHVFWERASTRPVNWIWNNPVPMSLQWNIKYVCLQLNYTLYFLSMLTYCGYDNRINRTTVVAFVLFSLVDTLMYFYNYKTFGYSITYLTLLIIWILVYLWQTPKK